MKFAEVYVDESGSHDGSPALCLAGYVFSKSNARRFRQTWMPILTRNSLPYFHMVDCAHGTPPFDGDDWPKERRLKVEKCLIRNTRNLSDYGFAVSVSEEQFDNVIAPEIAPRHGVTTAYTFCLMHCLFMVRRWADRKNFHGQIDYVFEAGHSSAGEAHKYLTALFVSKRMRETYRYGSHRFASKTEVVQLQCADLLAWLWSKRIKDRGIREPRRDLLALIREQDRCIEYDSLDVFGVQSELRIAGFSD